MNNLKVYLFLYGDNLKFSFIMIVVKKMENQKVLENINSIKERVSSASLESIDARHKKNRNVKIVAISKRQPLERLIEALNSGHNTFGRKSSSRNT